LENKLKMYEDFLLKAFGTIDLKEIEQKLEKLERRLTEEKLRDEMLHLTESIEGYMETWDAHDSLADFETFQLLYEKLCGLVGKEPKDLEELAYGLDADREP